MQQLLMRQLFDIAPPSLLWCRYLSLAIATLALELGCIEIVCSAERLYLVGGLGYSSSDGIVAIDRQSVDLSPSATGFSGASLPIDDSDFSWHALAGYRLNDYFGLEAGFFDLGSFRAKPNALFAFPNEAEIGVRQIYIGARFRAPVYKKLYAAWTIGATRASFDARGNLLVEQIVLSNPPPLPPPIFITPGEPTVVGPVRPAPVINFVDPDDEYGFLLGFGFELPVTNKISLGLDYRRHDARIQTIETIDLSLILGL